jgi:hypothetical protein
MRRTALVVLLAAGVGLAAGAVGQSKKFKFLPDRWNRQVDLTEVELACMQSAFAAEPPLSVVKDRLTVTRIVPEVRSTHIHLMVQVTVQGNAAEPPAARELEAASQAVLRHWRDKLLKHPLPEDPSDCPVTIDLLRGQEILYRFICDDKGRRGFENPPL